MERAGPGVIELISNKPLEHLHPRRETNLYPPLKNWLEHQGYRVRGEVGHCDLAAEKEGELIAVEIKLRPSLALLCQAVRRQEYSDAVYIALPQTHVARGIRQILKRLGIGLVFVVFLRNKIKVEVEFHPSPEDRPPLRRVRKKAILLREIEGRDLDLTPGGLVGGKSRITSYRQQSIRLAVWLQQLGTASPSQLVKLGAREDAGRILSRNAYGWFERVNRGIYRLHPAGCKALTDVPALRTLYHDQLKNKKG